MGAWITKGPFSRQRMVTGSVMGSYSCRKARACSIGHAEIVLNKMRREAPRQFPGNDIQETLTELRDVPFGSGNGSPGPGIVDRVLLLVERSVRGFVRVHHVDRDLRMAAEECVGTPLFIESHGVDFQIDHVVRAKMFTDLLRWQR